MKEYYEVNYNGNYYNGKIGVKIDEGSYTITIKCGKPTPSGVGWIAQY